MARRLQTIGIILALFGVGFVAVAGIAFAQIQNGYGTLDAFSAEQNVVLSYNEDGQLTDRGTTEGAEAIMTLLTEDWNFPVVESDLNPDNPVVNTASEYMFQMATIGYHILHGTQTVVLAEDVEYEGVLYPAGTYDFEVDGRYWTDFDRRHPIEGPARSQAWSGTAHGLFAELGVGTTTHSTLQLGLGLAGTLAGVGLFALIAGFGLIWVSRAKMESFASEAKESDMPREKAMSN